MVVEDKQGRRKSSEDKRVDLVRETNWQQANSVRWNVPCPGNDGPNISKDSYPRSTNGSRSSGDQHLPKLCSGS